MHRGEAACELWLAEGGPVAASEVCVVCALQLGRVKDKWDCLQSILNQAGVPCFWLLAQGTKPLSRMCVCVGAVQLGREKDK